MYQVHHASAVPLQGLMCDLITGELLSWENSQTTSRMEQNTRKVMCVAGNLAIKGFIILRLNGTKLYDKCPLFNILQVTKIIMPLSPHRHRKKRKGKENYSLSLPASSCKASSWSWHRFFSCLFFSCNFRNSLKKLKKNQRCYLYELNNNYWTNQRVEGNKA